jgi:hypothetical protein
MTARTVSTQWSRHVSDTTRTYPLALLVIALGAIPLLRDTIAGLRERRYALDYLALLAIAASVVALEFQVGAEIAIMLASGRALSRLRRATCSEEPEPAGGPDSAHRSGSRR